LIAVLFIFVCVIFVFPKPTPRNVSLFRHVTQITCLMIFFTVIHSLENVENNDAVCVVKDSVKWLNWKSYSVFVTSDRHVSLKNHNLNQSLLQQTQKLHHYVVSVLQISTSLLYLAKAALAR